MLDFLDILVSSKINDWRLKLLQVLVFWLFSNKFILKSPQIIHLYLTKPFVSISRLCSRIFTRTFNLTFNNYIFNNLIFSQLRFPRAYMHTPPCSSPFWYFSSEIQDTDDCLFTTYKISPAAWQIRGENNNIIDVQKKKIRILLHHIT